LKSYQLGSTYPSVVEVEAGDNLIITLEENPSTGYRWMVIDQDLKARGLFDVVKLTNETYT
jgi:predicted secreted protein